MEVKIQQTNTDTEQNEGQRQIMKSLNSNLKNMKIVEDLSQHNHTKHKKS